MAPLLSRLGSSNFGFNKKKGGGAAAPSGNWFGNGSDGSLNTSGNVTYTVQNKSGSFDGDTVVLQYTSLTVNSGHSLTVDQPCRGLVIYVTGNCTINGTISMSQKGGKSDPTLNGGGDASTVNPLGLRWIFRTASPNGDSLTISPTLYNGCGPALKNAAGNAGSVSNGTIIGISRDGYGQPSRPGGDSAGFDGVPWTFTNPFVVGSGSGGGGSSLQNGTPYPGSAGAGGLGGCFSGGAGGGAAGGPFWIGTPLPPGGNYGGVGGDAYVGSSYLPGFGAGGVGNPNGTPGGGAPSPINSFGSGVGGMITLIVGGTLNLGSTAIIEAKGVRGQTVNPPAGYAMPGGASGGGAIMAIASNLSGVTAGSYVGVDPTSKINANGGSGNPGGNGGNGGILVAQVLP
jgi:hypothetical protein